MPKASQSVQMIPIDRINILNPRVRNQKLFAEFRGNISKVGLKRPITVTPCHSGTAGKDYDLVCGQGRIEAFMACGQTHIPALVVDASEQDALVMSLVENMARRKHRAIELYHGIELLAQQGYDAQDISKKTGLSYEYTSAVINLLKRGEERLLAAVEAGHMPISLAIRISENPEDEQRALQEAYESKQLRGNRLLHARRLIEIRRRSGKYSRPGPKPAGARASRDPTNVRDIMKAYQKEVDRKLIMVRKAEVASMQLVFIVESLRELLKEDNFKNLLKAEGLQSILKPIMQILKGKAA